MGNPFTTFNFTCCTCPEPDGYDAEVDDPLPKYRHRCGCPTASLECESVEKVAQLIGYSEFTNPSSPPKKYLRADVSGTHSLFNALGNGTTGTWSGYYEYVPGGTDVNALLFSWADVNVTLGTTSGTCTNTCGGTSFFKLSMSGCRYPISSGDCNTELTNVVNPQSTRTTFSVDPRQSPIDSTGTWLAQLGAEDTEEAALARATETEGTSCTSIYELRTTSFSFTVRTATYTIKASNLQPGVTYEGCVRIQRRKAYSGTIPDDPDTGEEEVIEWEDVASDTFSGITRTEANTDEDGVTTVEENIALPGGDEDSIGWEYQALSVHIWPSYADCTCPTDDEEPAP
jgi:hypothetical protein